MKFKRTLFLTLLCTGLLSTFVFSQEAKRVPRIAKFEAIKSDPAVQFKLRGRLLKTDAKPVDMEYVILYTWPFKDSTGPQMQGSNKGKDYVEKLQKEVADPINGAIDDLRNNAESEIAQKFNIDPKDLGVQADQEENQLLEKGFKFQKMKEVPIEDKMIPVRLFAREVYAPEDDCGYATWEMLLKCDPRINEAGNVQLNPSLTFKTAKPIPEGTPAGINPSVLSVRLAAFQTTVQLATTDLLNMLKTHPWNVPDRVRIEIEDSNTKLTKDAPIPLPLMNNLIKKPWKEKMNTIPFTLKDKRLVWFSSGKLEIPIAVTGISVPQKNEPLGDPEW